MARARVRLAVPPEPPRLERPYPDFEPQDRRAIEEALCAAWERLRASQKGDSLHSIGEVKVTELLVDLLNSLLEEEGASSVRKFSSGRFETVIRGGEVRNHSGESFEKRPDLVFRYSGQNRPGVSKREHHGLFVECKIIDESHSARDYANDGLRRFIRGEYAWKMPSAMMVAYVRNGATVPSGLTPHLSQERYREDYQVKDLPRKRVGVMNERVPPIYLSRHGRPGVRVDGVHLAGDIEVAHLWLQVLA